MSDLPLDDFVDFGGGVVDEPTTAAPPPAKQPTQDTLAKKNADATVSEASLRPKLSKPNLSMEDSGGGPTEKVDRPAPAPAAPPAPQPVASPVSMDLEELCNHLAIQAGVPDAEPEGEPPVEENFVPQYEHSETGVKVQPTPAPQGPDMPLPAPPVQPLPPAAVIVAAKPVAADADVADADNLWAEIEVEIARLDVETGYCVLRNRTSCDDARPHHIAIREMRYNALSLPDQSASYLAALEAALAANQAYVQGQENYWSARAKQLGVDRENLLRSKRSKYTGATEKAKEDAVIRAEPDVRRLHREYVKADAIKSYLGDIGQAFAKVDDGIKRLADNRRDEENRAGIAARRNT
jgi:hypothetical protein